jgi:hypothetical protein
MKIRPVGAELFHADGQTDMTKLTVAVPNIANACKNVFVCVSLQKASTERHCSYSQWQENGNKLGVSKYFTMLFIGVGYVAPNDRNGRE